VAKEHYVVERRQSQPNFSFETNDNKQYIRQTSRIMELRTDGQKDVEFEIVFWIGKL